MSSKWEVAERRAEPAWLSAREAAERIGCSVGQLSRWRREDKGPPWRKLGRGPRARVQYDAARLKQWIAALPTGGEAPMEAEAPLAPVGTVCAWCGLLHVGDMWRPESVEGLVSHGMCPACQARFELERRGSCL